MNRFLSFRLLKSAISKTDLLEYVFISISIQLWYFAIKLQLKCNFIILSMSWAFLVRLVWIEFSFGSFGSLESSVQTEVIRFILNSSSYKSDKYINSERLNQLNTTSKKTPIFRSSLSIYGLRSYLLTLSVVHFTRLLVCCGWHSI